MKIPILNIYYLLCYAWDKLEEGELADAGIEQSTELLDLYANVLANGVTHVLHQGLARDYVTHEADIPGVRGKIQTSVTAKLDLLRRGRTYCTFDELQYDILHNQILKATIRNLARAPIEDKTRATLANLYRRLSDISDISLSTQHFRRVQLYRNNAFYGFLINVCAVVHEGLLVNERSGKIEFRDFVRDESRMRKLFERFVHNFLLREQHRYDVRRPQLKWSMAAGEPAALELLPVMQTDIVLERPGQRIIIDTKFYREVLQASEYKKTLHSENLYQLYAYLRNLEAREGPGTRVEGILLYPTVADALDLEYSIDGYRIRIKTLSLGEPWQSIRANLLALVA